MDWRMRGAAVTVVIAGGVVCVWPGPLTSAVAVAAPDDGGDDDSDDHSVVKSIADKVREARAGRDAGGGTAHGGSAGTAAAGIPRAASLPPVPVSAEAHTIDIRRQPAPAVPATPATPRPATPETPGPATPATPVHRTPPNSFNVPGVGEVVLAAAIAEKYRQAGGAAVLGMPTGRSEKAGDGTVQPFANGNIYNSPATGPHVVHGQILKTYLAEGGPTGPLGFPMTDEFEVCGLGPSVAHGGWGGEFEGGYVWWLNWGDAKRTFSAYVTGKDGSPGCECGKVPL